MNSLRKMVEKEDQITLIASFYAASVGSFLDENDRSTRTNYIIYIYRVDQALNSLNERYRELIKNDFFNGDKPMWWKSIYSSRLYLNMRGRAVGSFLTHFYEN